MLEANSILHNFFKQIKFKYPKVYTIACGSPLKPAIGLIDSLRIGPDIIFPQVSRIPFIKEVINNHKINRVLQNVKERSWTRAYWNLDPDVFVCRPNMGIADKKILELQQMIKNLGGNIFLGDDLTDLSEDRIIQFIKPLFD